MEWVLIIQALLALFQSCPAKRNRATVERILRGEIGPLEKRTMKKELYRQADKQLDDVLTQIDQGAFGSTDVDILCAELGITEDA